MSMFFSLHLPQIVSFVLQSRVDHKIDTHPLTSAARTSWTNLKQTCSSMFGFFWTSFLKRIIWILPKYPEDEAVTGHGCIFILVLQLRAFISITFELVSVIAYRNYSAFFHLIQNVIGLKNLTTSRHDCPKRSCHFFEKPFCKIFRVVVVVVVF